MGKWQRVCEFLLRRADGSDISFTVMSDQMRSPLSKDSLMLYVATSTTGFKNAVPLSVKAVCRVCEILSSPMDDIQRYDDVRAYTDTYFGEKRLVLVKITPQPAISAVIFDNCDFERARNYFYIAAQIMIRRLMGSHESTRNIVAQLITAAHIGNALEECENDSTDWCHRKYREVTRRDGVKFTPMMVEAMDKTTGKSDQLHKAWFDVITVLGAGVEPPLTLNPFDVEEFALDCLVKGHHEKIPQSLTVMNKVVTFLLDKREEMENSDFDCSNFLLI